MKTKALIGGAAWSILVVLVLLGRLHLGTVEVMFLLAPLVTVPLGFELLERLAPWLKEQAAFRAACFVQPMGAAAAVASFFLPTSPAAGALAALWLGVCALAGISGLVILGRIELRVPILCVAASLGFLQVGGAGLVASRSGVPMAGFEEPIVLLTAVHFHYTGFAAPLLVAALAHFAGDALRRSRLLPVAALGVVAATPVIAVGFMFSPLLKLAGVVWLVTSIFVFSLLTFFSTGGLRGPGRPWLVVSSSAVWVGLALALVYAVGEYTGVSYIGLAEMARYHGVANGVGFVLCGLLGWTLHAESVAAAPR